MSKIHMLIIDPQWDFCHAGKPGYDPANPNPDKLADSNDRPGALYVPGADADCLRTAAMIRKGKKKIDDLSITLDTHRPIHVAHADYYRNGQGEMPNPFEMLTVDDFIGQNPKWRTFSPGCQEWVEKTYLPGLRDRGRNPLCIWPKHCIVGTKGWTVNPDVQEAVQEWCEDEFAAVNWKFKGQNTRTEWYSAVGADVEDPTDRQTALDTDFIARFNDADLFAFLGQARNFCLRWSFADIVEHFGDNFLKKCLMITDCTSNVPIPEVVAEADTFFEECIRNGMQTCTAEEFVSDV
jgi:nicotinamidase/pyrazinamidase